MNTQKKISNFEDEDLNPCVEESNLSRKCLEKYDYDYKKCGIYFDNYNNCKKFWGNVHFARKKAGIHPFMPTKEERQKIMDQRKKGTTVISAS